jgi:hypothetical protein
MIIEQLYDALLAAGAPEDKAREAARAVAEFQTTLRSLDKRLTRIEALLSINVIATVVGVIKAFM